MMKEQKHITLYSSSECYRCALVKQMLDKNNVQYEEIRDNKPLMIEKDLIGVPAIEIDGKIIDEYTSVLIWLKDNNYYCLWEDEDESN